MLMALALVVRALTQNGLASIVAALGGACLVQAELGSSERRGMIVRSSSTVTAAAIAMPL